MIALVLLSFLSQGEALQRNIGIDAIGYEADAVVGAPYSSIMLEFPVPRLAKIQSATATISLTPNSQLNGENIFFFYFNDKLVETLTVKEIRQKKTFTLKLPAPQEFLSVLRLQIKSNLFISDDLCRDYYSGGLFFTVHKDTNITLNYDMSPIRTVADFFGSFQQSVLVVVPDGASLNEFAPGAWTYGLLKKEYPQLDIRFVRASELSSMPPVPRIWVGLDSKLPAYFKGAVSGITLVDANTLLISAPDLPKLRSFVQQLADLPVFTLNPTNAKRIAITPVETAAIKATEAVSFGSYNVQEGIQVVSSFFRLFPALLEKVPERIGLHLEGSYSVANESAKGARLDIFMNNSLVHSSALDQTGQFKREFVLPDSFELRAQNDLTVQVRYPDEQGQCLIRGKMQYAQLFPTSYMSGYGQHRSDHFTWSNIGLFFNRQGTVLIDEKLGANSFRIAAEIVALMNRQLPPGVFAFPEYLPLSQQVDVSGGGYVFVAAMTDSVPAALQERMPISLGKNFTVYRKNTQTTLFEYQPQTDSVVGRVGEVKGVPLILLTSNLDGGLLTDALRYLGRSKNYDSLNGNILVYQPPKRLFSFDVYDRKLKVEKPAAKANISDFWEQYKTPILIGVGILILLIVIVLIYRLVSSRRQTVDGESVRSDQSYTPFK